jgi:hypothetical protein
MIEQDKRADQIKERWRKWYDARSDWDIQAREDIDFYLGNHFTDKEASDLAERNQMGLPIDRLYAAIEQFKAIITSKPPKFSATGREDSDNKLANVWKVILEYIWDNSDGDEVFKQVIHDFSVAGLGYFYGYIDPEDDYGRGEVKFTYVDPFRVVVDPNSRNKWFDDASGMQLSTVLTRAQLLDAYPMLGEEDEEGEAIIDGLESIGSEDETYPESTQRQTGASFTPDTVKDYDWGSARDKYKLIEDFSKVKVPFFRIVDIQSGEEKVLDSKGFETLLADDKTQEAFDKGQFDVVEVQQTRIKCTCIVGQVVLYEKILDTNIFPLVPVPNIWTNTPYPMSDVRKNKGFQRFLNKVMSLITSHAQASSGLKLLIPQGSVQDIEELERDWANPNATIEYDASFGEPHFPSPQPLAGSILQLPQMVEHYIDLNIGIFEMQQGNAEASPKTSSGTMMMEDFGQRRSKSKLRDVEASLKRLGKLMYHLAKSHYDFKKTFRLVQPNNDISEYTVNNRVYDDKNKEVQTIENNLSVGSFDIRIIGNSTMPSNKWGEWNVYMEAYQAGLIDKVEALKKTEIFDKEGVMKRTDQVAQLQGQLQQAQEEIKKLSGDLQTAHRETIQSRKQVEVAKFQGKLKEQEYDSKTQNKVSIDRLNNAVKLESEKLRLATQVEQKRSQPQGDEKLQK